MSNKGFIRRESNALRFCQSSFRSFTNRINYERSGKRLIDHVSCVIQKAMIVSQAVCPAETTMKDAEF